MQHSEDQSHWHVPDCWWEIRLMAKFSGQLGRLGLGIFWSILNFIWQFWGSGGVPLASQHLGDSKSLILSPIRWIWVQFRPISMKYVIFRKVDMASWHDFYRVFCPGASKSAISMFAVGTKKMRDEKLCRFVVVSPREVPYSSFLWPFKIFNCPSFLKDPLLCLAQFRQFSVH